MSNRTTRRPAPGVNAGSMADIAFLLLIFFLVTTTIAEDQGVLVRLPQWVDEPVIQDVNREHTLTVQLNAANELLVEERRARIPDLPGLLREHVLSPKRRPNQAIVSLVHDRGTEYTSYLAVYDALLAGYRALWDEAAHRDYGRAYAELDEAGRRSVRRGIPLVISEAEPSDHAPAPPRQ